MFYGLWLAVAHADPVVQILPLPQMPEVVTELHCENIEEVPALYAELKKQGDAVVAQYVLQVATVVGGWPHTLKGKTNLGESLRAWTEAVEAIDSHANALSEFLYQFIDTWPTCEGQWDHWYDRDFSALEVYLDRIGEFDFVNLNYVQRLTKLLEQLQDELNQAESELDELAPATKQKWYEESGYLTEFSQYYKSDAEFLDDEFRKALTGEPPAGAL